MNLIYLILKTLQSVLRLLLYACDVIQDVLIVTFRYRPCYINVLIILSIYLFILSHKVNPGIPRTYRRIPGFETAGVLTTPTLTEHHHVIDNRPVGQQSRAKQATIGNILNSSMQSTTMSKRRRRVVLAVHGGAGVILRSALTPEMEEEYRSALRDALAAGYAVLMRRSKEEEDGDRNGGGQEEDVATDAVEAAVRCMEDCPLFNAGKGSVFTHDGQIRCDASIMACSSFDNNKAACIDNAAAAPPPCDKAKDDDNINTDNNNEGTITTPHQIIQKRRYPKTPHPKAGAVAGVRNIQNPISLAKAVMHRTPHVMLLGRGAEDFARQLSQEARVQIQPDDYFWTERRWKQLVSVRNAESEEEEKHNQQVRKVQLDHSIPQEEVVESSDVDDNDEQREKKFGTVGSIALYRRPDYDSSNSYHYQLASATSTGGMTNVRHHRVGDSPIIGAGTYANHLCAISCTGHGEWFIRCVAAHDIAKRLEYKYGYDGTSCEATTDNTLLKKALDEVIFGTLMSESDSGEQGGDGGAIVLDKDGNFAADMNCPGMYHGWVYEDGEMETRIFWNE